MVGQQRYRSASGEIELGGAAGTVEIEAVSGAIRLSGPGPVKVRARTISGDTELETAIIQALNLSTTSGDMRLMGAFDANGEHRISTVSGNVELNVDGGLRVDASTISGDITSDVAHRSEGGRGRRSLIVGDGAAALYFKSVSGDLRIRSNGARGQRVDMVRTPDAVAADENPRRDGPPPNMDRIAILEGVERGEITVAEASRWLALLGDGE
jgi:putative adhesin